MAPAPLLCAVMLATLGAASAYPYFWAALDEHCPPGQPTRPEGAHGAPVADPSTAFEIADASGAPVTQVCAGQKYTVTVSFPQKRNVLLTSSVGSLTGSSNGGFDLPPCPSRALTDVKAAAPSFGWSAPAGAAAGTLVLKATSATGDTGAFQLASTTLPLKAAGACAAAPKASPSPSPAAAPKAAAPQAPAPKAAAPGAAAPKPAACPPSNLGYECAHSNPDGTTIHYTLGGALPPPNACTSGASAAAGPNAAAPAAEMLHFAMTAPAEYAQGYLGVSFPQTVGTMSPASAVIGTFGSGGGPQVGTWQLSGTSAGSNTSASNWATQRGLARLSSGEPVLCFSRPLNSSVSMAVGQSIGSTGYVGVNYAACKSPSLSVEHQTEGAVNLYANGSVAPATLYDSAPAIIVAHAALMLAAFGALMPIGAIIARHKWMFGAGGDRKVSPWWFHSHRAVQLLAVAAAIAGVVLATVGTGVTPLNDSAWRPHYVIGLLAVCMAFVQLFIGLVRPALGSPKRVGWYWVHAAWGSLTVLLGWANLLIGAVLIHRVDEEPYSTWITAAVVLIGASLVAFAGLEWAKRRLQARGEYDPSAQTLAGAGAKALTASVDKPGSSGRGDDVVVDSTQPSV